MTILDAATEAYIAELVAEAPPLTPEQAALITRIFAGTDTNPASAAAFSPRERKVALYRHYDADGILLYIGISSDPESRNKTHARSSSWRRFAAHADFVWLSDRDTALAAEKEAIQVEVPLFNRWPASGERSRRLVDYLVKHEAWDLLGPR